MILLQTGIFFACLNIIFEYFWWTNDWWQPYTVTHTRIGIEDFILGFFGSGVGASLYLFVRKKKLIQEGKQNVLKKLFLVGMISIGGLLLFALLFSLKVNSFSSTVIVILSACAIIFTQNKKLIFPAVINGALLLVLTTPIYWVMMIATPHVIEKIWLTHKLLGIYFLNIPFEDYVFNFLVGVLTFCFYPFYTNAQIVKIKK